MKAILRNVSLAALAAIAIAVALGQSGDLVNAPGGAEPGLVLGATVGILVFFILHFRRSNRAAAPADADARVRALTFVCPRDRALVYFIRTGLSGAAVGIDIDVDDRTVAQIKSPRFTCLMLAPGTHSFNAHVGDGRSSLAPASALLSVTLAAGSVTLLHVGIQRTLLKSNLAFEPWTLDMAKARLSKVAMVLPDPAATSLPS